MGEHDFQHAVLGELREQRLLLQTTIDSHEVRIRTLERKSDWRTSVISSIVSVTIALIAAFSAGCLPPAPVQHPTPAEIRAVADSVVKITVVRGGQAWSGTGTFVETDRGQVVLTAGHVCETGALHTIELQDGTQTFAWIELDSADETTADLCVLGTFATVAHPLKLAQEAPQLGDVVWYYGYPSGMPSVYVGRLSSQDVNGYFFASIAGYLGASGAAVLDARGDVVGVLVRVNGNFTVQSLLVPLGTTRAFIAQLPGA